MIECVKLYVPLTRPGLEPLGKLLEGLSRLVLVGALTGNHYRVALTCIESQHAKDALSIALVPPRNPTLH